MLDLLNPVNIMKKGIISVSKLLFLVVIMSFLSILITFFVSVIIRVPSEMSKELSYYVENKYLTSEIHTSCNFNEEVNSNNQCIDILKKQYSIYIDLDIILSDSLPIYLESEIEFFSEKHPEKNFSIKKVTFLKEESKLIQVVSDLLLLIPRLFGYYNSEKLTIAFINDFDNSIFNLEKIKYIINSNQIGISNSNIYFIPNLSFVQYFIGKIYYLTLCLILIGSFISQVLMYSIITCYSLIWGERNEVKEKNE